MQFEEFDGLRLVAGDPILDFVNSIKYRGNNKAGDRLNTFRDLCRWCLCAGIITQTEFDLVAQAETPKTHAQAIKLREAFRSFLHDPTDQASFEMLSKLLNRARPNLERADNGKRIFFHVRINKPSDLVRRLEYQIARFLISWPPERIKACEADDCDWVFWDKSKAGRRRWCDSQICGNRDRVRRHRAR